jgi:hypothetical protein
MKPAASPERLEKQASPFFTLFSTSSNMDFHGFLLVDARRHREAGARFYRLLAEAEESGELEEAFRKAGRVIRRSGGIGAVEVKIDGDLGLRFEAYSDGSGRLEPSLVSVMDYGGTWNAGEAVEYALVKVEEVVREENGHIHPRLDVQTR